MEPNQEMKESSFTDRVFVGRRREMAQLKAAMDDALSGHGQMVMLVGEPGIGKTRTAQELAESLTAAIPLFLDGLTLRKVEVVRLIAGGKTNPGVAEELVIAEGTARRHVANIYEKIGAANRVEAAAYANREGLLPEDDNLTSPA